MTYDPTLLTIASTGALTPTAELTTVTYSITSVDSHHSVLSASLSGGTGFSVGSTPQMLVNITANVPTTAPYFNKAVLNLGSVVVNSTAATGISGVDEAAYYGDVSGEKSLNALDASLVNQVGAGAGTGFSSYKDLDPTIIGAVSGDTLPSALDASLINQQGSGSTLPFVPHVPVGVSPPTGGPDPYLYFGSVQAGPGQTTTVTLYLDITDPNGVPLAALDEAIGYDPDMLQVSNIRAASALDAIASYGTAGTVDNQSGVLLVGQAFAGSGLPPVLPYGTNVAVLQFDVTVNADAPIGSATTLTLLQDGTVNGQTKFTAISDNEGALTWTAGMAPSNSGNPAMDGSVTIVTAAAPAVTETTVPMSTHLVAPKVVEPVRRVLPVSTLSQPATVPVPAGSLAAGTELPTAGTVIADVSPAVSSPVTLTQAEITIVSAPLVVTPTGASEALQAASVAPSTSRFADPGAALSLAASGTNRTVAATGTTNVKSSTSVLDDVYRQLRTVLDLAPVNVGNLGAGNDDTATNLSEIWDLDTLLLDRNSDKE